MEEVEYLHNAISSMPFRYCWLAVTYPPLSISRNFILRRAFLLPTRWMPVIRVCVGEWNPGNEFRGCTLKAPAMYGISRAWRVLFRMLDNSCMVHFRPIGWGANIHSTIHPLLHPALMSEKYASEIPGSENTTLSRAFSKVQPEPTQNYVRVRENWWQIWYAVWLIVAFGLNGSPGYPEPALLHLRTLKPRRQVSF